MQEGKPSTKEKVLGLLRKAGSSTACILTMWGSRKSAEDRAAEAKLMAGEELQNLIHKFREEIDQLNRDYAAAKVRIVSMRRTGVDKMKIMPHLQALKRMEARINQKNKLLQNVEASADTASDAELVIESAKAQKQMLDIQKHTLSRAFKGTDVEDLVDDLQEHHEDITDINEALSGMQLGGGVEEITEEDFDQWMDENVEEQGIEVPGPPRNEVHLPEVPSQLEMVPDRKPGASAAGVRARKPKVAQFAL